MLNVDELKNLHSIAASLKILRAKSVSAKRRKALLYNPVLQERRKNSVGIFL